MDLNYELLKEYGHCRLGNIELVSIIGEIEGHDLVSDGTKATKYDHMLPYLASLTVDEEVEGILFLIHTIGGDVSCGLALAEMIACMNKPTVSYVIGDSHSIGVPLAVAPDYSIIAPSATMIVHPVRMSGMIIGARQTYEQFRQMEQRIIQFISSHSKIEKSRLEEMMMNSDMFSKDLGTLLIGKQAVQEKIIDREGDFMDALNLLRDRIKCCRGVDKNGSKEEKY